MGMAGAESPAPWSERSRWGSRHLFCPDQRTGFRSAQEPLGVTDFSHSHLKPAHSDDIPGEPREQMAKHTLTVLCLSYKGAQSLPLLSWVSCAIYGSVGVHVPVCEPVYAER